MDSNAVPPTFPPPPTAPPLITPPSPSRPPKRGRGWMIFALILLVMLGFSMLVNFGQFLSAMVPVKGHNRNAGPRLEEVMLRDNDASDKIAVLDIDGIITGSATDQSAYSLVEVVQAQL